jgi:hypothetical protein
MMGGPSGAISGFSTTLLVKGVLEDVEFLIISVTRTERMQHHLDVVNEHVMIGRSCEAPEYILCLCMSGKLDVSTLGGLTSAKLWQGIRDQRYTTQSSTFSLQIIIQPTSIVPNVAMATSRDLASALEPCRRLPHLAPYPLPSASGYVRYCQPT